MTNKDLFNSVIIKNPASVDAVIDKMYNGKARYDSVAVKTRIPWYFIAVVHILEGGGKFTGHLHNGDPLTARTVRVPAKRPAKGNPPFTWEESAIDAMEFKRFASLPPVPGTPEKDPTIRLSWGIGVMLDRLEAYNGMGYRRKGIPTPYLWSGSQHYIKGKYVADGKYDLNAVSKQIGAAVILKRMADRKLIQLS